MPRRVAAHAFARRDAAAPIVRLGGETMGTSWSAAMVAAPPGIGPAIERLLAELIAELSHWEPQSAISRFNRAPMGAWIVLPPRLRHVLDAGLSIWRQSQGAFDPALGVLAGLWGFGPEGPCETPPSQAEIELALAMGGAAAIECDGARVRRTAPVELDLSGIAKGYAVDCLADLLTANGVHDFLVEIGGEFVGRGIKPDGQPWWVDVEAPPGLTVTPLRVALHEEAIASSGDYRRFLMHGGKRYAHTIDPQGGWSLDGGVRSVTVICDDCMHADAWATAISVMGAEKGLQLANQLGLSARIVLTDGRAIHSDALTARCA